MTGQKKVENIVYAILWIILFVAPLLLMYINSLGSHTLIYDWEGVYNAWRLLALFCVAFYVHNLFLAPLLVYKAKKWIYGLSTCVLIFSFVFCQNLIRPGDHPRKFRTEIGRPKKPNDDMGENPFGKGPKEHDKGADKRKGIAPPPGPRRPDSRFDKHRPPEFISDRNLIGLVIITLLLGINIGSKYFFKTLDYRRRMQELEHENKSRQLEYLKYQINPHFFMNTLNNIHALVDIDPGQAKVTIEILSKLMRHILYDGNTPMVHLKKELTFITHYVDLMRIRYTDNVKINLSFPENIPDAQIPSLLYITFVENAFKHGVSYERKSFIDIDITISENSIIFTCDNSRKPKKEDTHGGVGLQNAINRLNLIYCDDYTLDIDQTDEEYCVRLILPLQEPMLHEKKS